MAHDAALVALGKRLRAIGYDVLHIERRIGRVRDRLTPSFVALAERRAGDDPLGLAIRFWNLGLPLPRSAVSEMLGGVDLATLVASRLVDGDGDTPRAALRVTAALGRLHAHDFDRGAALPADHVLGVGAATRTLSGITPRVPVERALDLGTGCGTQAFGLARHATTVVATDISERAAWTARVGVALNGLEQVEVRVGDGLEPVAGDDFDLVVCNPPFVVSPDEELTFRDSGSRGDALSRELVTATAGKLRPGGVACVLVNWVVPAGEDAASVAQGWVQELAADVLLLHHDALGPLAYAERWAMLPGDADLEQHRSELDRWVAELERLGAAKVAAGAFVIRRTDGSARVRVARMQKRPNEGGAQVARMLDAIGVFSGPGDPALATTVFRLVPGHRLEQRLHHGASAYAAGVATLRLDRSAGVTSTVPADLLEAVFLIDGQRDLASIAAEVGVGRGRTAAELEPALRTVVVELYETGFLEIAATT